MIHQITDTNKSDQYSMKCQRSFIDTKTKFDTIPNEHKNTGHNSRAMNLAKVARIRKRKN